MFAFTLPIALALVSSAGASPLPSAGNASASGVVEVPLLAGPSRNDPYFYVEAKVGEETLLLRLVTEHPFVLLSDGAVKRLQLKMKGKDHPDTAYVDEKHAQVATMALGGATLSEVAVHPYPLRRDEAVLGVDGEIGLAGFPSVAWAFVPSKGVLRIAPAAEAAPLLAAIGGVAVPFRTNAGTKEKVGKDKVTMDVTPYVIPVAFSGVELPTELRLGVGSRLATEIEGGTPYHYADIEIAPIALPPAPGRADGEGRDEWRELTVAGTRVWSWVERAGGGPAYRYAVNAEIGVDVLRNFDFAVDPAHQALAMKGGVAPLRGDGAAVIDARLKKAVDEAGKDAKDDAARAEARRGALASYAAFLQERGDAAAVPVWKEVAEGEPERCDHWLNYGKVLRRAGSPADAIDALTRADSLYTTWAGVSLAERVDLEERYAAGKKKKETWEGTVPQDHVCATAAGRLALSRLDQRDSAAVAALYPARLDLDAVLPTVAGIDALRAGRADAAQAAFRQAERLDGVARNSNARLGLFLAFQGTSVEQARVQLEDIQFQFMGRTEPHAVELYAAALRPSGQAIAALEAAVAQHPGDAVLLTQLGVEQNLAGDAAAAARSFTAAEARFKDDLAAVAGGSALAEYAWYLTAVGRAADARPVADQAVTLMPDSGLAWLARSRAEADPAQARVYLEQARRAWLLNPAYAMLAP